ncbi:MAG: hypothetical protein Q8941_03585 [Bacteroidota bacterium]|nr:hypothetical protein [Bacteroidota bacterium]
MNNSTNDMSEKLVKYLDGELAGAEKEDIERQLAADPALQEELETLKLAREAVRSYGLQKQVAGIHRQMMNEAQAPVRNIGSTRRIIRYSMSIAAGIFIIFLGITTYNYLTISANKLFNDNYRPYELPTNRDMTNLAISPVEKAYREKNYAEVIRLAGINDSLPVKENFLLAMSYLELKDDSKAITNFKKVIIANESEATNVRKEEAEYYLSLTYLRSKDYDHALELMNKIQDNPNHLYHEKITGNLVTKIKRLR